MMYKSGQKPQVGDIVKIVDTKNTNTYYNGVVGFDKGDKYNVLSVTAGIKNTLIQVENNWRQKVRLKANRFELVHTLNESGSNKMQKFMIMNADLSSVIKRVDDGKLTQALADLITQNPSKTFHVFQYDSSVKAKSPQMEIFNAAR